MMIRHADLNAMWMADLARFIWKEFHRPQPTTIDNAYNLDLAGKVWRDRFGAYPTYGEIRAIIEE